MRRISQLALWLLPVGASALPSLELHGTRYASACASPEWAVTGAALSRHQHAEGLARFARALWCLPGSEAAPVLARYGPARLPVRTNSTGDKPSRSREPIAKALPPREGQAWNVTVQDSGNGVRLSYMESEACLRSVELEWSGTSWRVQFVELACD